MAAARVLPWAIRQAWHPHLLKRFALLRRDSDMAVTAKKNVPKTGKRLEATDVGVVEAVCACVMQLP